MNYILTTQTENELYHYGVPGMKWGVIRWKNKHYDKQLQKQKEKAKLIKEKERLKSKKEKLDALISSNTKRKQALKSNSKPNDQSSDSTKRKTPTDDVKRMSNEELKNKVNRLQMEQQYLSMTPKQVSKGKAFVSAVGKDVLQPAAEDIGRQVVKSLLTKVVNKTINDPDLKIHTNNKKK